MKRIILKENGLTGSSPLGYKLIGLSNGGVQLIDNSGNFGSAINFDGGLTYSNLSLSLKLNSDYLFIDASNNLSIATASRGGGGTGSGTPGTSGTSGAQGTSGESGTSGTSGTSGAQGTSGESGTSGTSGTGFNTITDYGNNRVLVSDGSSNSAKAFPSFSYDGSTLSVQGTLFIDGTFSISGSASTIDTTSLVVTDPIIALGHSQSNPSVLDIGIMFIRGAGLTQAIIWDRSEGQFALVGTNDDHTRIGDVIIQSYSDLRLNKLITSDIKISNGANQNYILISDSDGNASWTASIPGTSGTSGQSGTSGTSGQSGTSGTSGQAGTSGTSGQAGTSGTSGVSGTSGTSAPYPSVNLFNYYNFI